MKFRIFELSIIIMAFSLMFWANQEIVKAHWITNVVLVILFMVCMVGIFLIKDDDGLAK